MAKTNIQLFQSKNPPTPGILITMKIPVSLHHWLKKNNINRTKFFVHSCAGIGWREHK